MKTDAFRELLEATRALLPSENRKKLTVEELEVIRIKNLSDPLLLRCPSLRVREFTTYHTDESALRLKTAWDAAKVEIETCELAGPATQPSKAQKQARKRNRK